jgi:hypothetical protein
VTQAQRNFNDDKKNAASKMARVNRFGFLATAVIFHLVYIYSIFDIYFVSPIVSGMRQFELERPEGVEAPARRLVLYVGMCAVSVIGDSI